PASEPAPAPASEPAPAPATSAVPVPAEAISPDVPGPVPEAQAPEAAAGGAASEPLPAAVPEPAAVSPDTNKYVVVAGDTVSAIAARFGVTVGEVLAANGLGASGLIRPGQTLMLSGPPLEPAGPSSAVPSAVLSAVRTIYVAGSGGQALVDRCIGPIHFTPTDPYSLFIVEHDTCGGWARFSGIGVGETVVIAGYGTYTATGRGQVALGSTTNAVAALFGGFPRAILQTCVPGTTVMLLIALN
ncbi:LysM peptidoglycan-binding domain-containing protein, partial [Arthrobacter sp. PsM3]|uniref:LysM peptidoglycan-binding domain-containing protein n=1 Tax=Arthrobacter sp. PsM3 TaxID=3030531 RepID=UPI00263BAF84